jgi:hypothetical protein
MDSPAALSELRAGSTRRRFPSIKTPGYRFARTGRKAGVAVKGRKIRGARAGDLEMSGAKR